MKSRVTYVNNNLMHVEVNCEKINPDTTRVKTNDVHLTLNVPETTIQ